MRTLYFSRAAAVIGAFGILPVLVIVLKRAVEIPYWDEWEWAELIYGAHTHALTFAQLWAPHNEHRILVPNLVVLALDAAGGWSVVREQIISLVFLGLTQLTVWAIIRRTVREPRRGWCFLIATVLLFGFVQEENLGWGFQMAWFICDLCLVVAVWALTRPRRTPFDLALALATGTIASLSSSQGLVVWLSGLVAILLIPRRVGPTAIAWITVGAIVTAIVRSGSPGGDPAGHVGFAHVGLLGQYSLIYLGAPLAWSFGTEAAKLAGSAFVFWSVALAATLWRARSLLRVRVGPWLAIAAYPVACAIATGPARAGFGLVQANASRYTSITTLGWIALIAATFAAVPRGRIRVSLAAVPAAFVIIASVVQTFTGYGAWHQHSADLSRARADLAVGDRSGLPLVYPDRTRVTVLLGELARIHDGLFSGP